MSEAELEWIDAHLFGENVDTQATRAFLTEETIEARRLLRICDLIDAEAKLAAMRQVLEQIANCDHYPNRSDAADAARIA